MGFHRNGRRAGRLLGRLLGGAEALNSVELVGLGFVAVGIIGVVAYRTAERAVDAKSLWGHK